jgi:DNA-binding response OmpR family regulator
MKSPHILVAEDDRNILMGLVDTLESEGYTVTPATNGDEALRLLNAGAFDLMLLDVMMPGKSGYDVCRIVRRTDEDMPVVMLTAKGEEIDKVVGFELGADDYVTKPFGVRELLARIAAVLRRSRRNLPRQTTQRKGPDRFRFGDVEVDALQYHVTRNGRIVSLSARELDLLKCFYDHPNEVLTRDRLLNEVWGIDYGGTTRTLDQHVAQLRKKVESDPTHPKAIQTVHGVGYRYHCSVKDLNDSPE